MMQNFVHDADISHDVRYNGSLIKNASTILRIYGKWANVDVERFCLEVDNSTANQAVSYSNPSLSIDSSPIDWEQALQEGRSLHPLHRCRYPIVSSFREAKLYWVAVDSSIVNIQGEYMQWIKKLAPGADIDQSSVLFPVHELQLAKVMSEFPDARVLPETIDNARPQISLRTITLPNSTEVCVKIPLYLKVQNLVRTMSAWSIMMGQQLQLKQILPMIESASAEFEGSLMMTREYAGASSPSPHLGCIIRESSESQAARTGDRIIVCATLAENVDVIWGHLPEKKAILHEYTSKFLRAVLPPLFKYGLGLAAHPQNALLRLDPSSKEIKGFVIRDLGFMRIHRPTFQKTTSSDIETPKTSIYTETLEEVYRYMFNPAIIGHLSYFVRALYPGLAGWKVVREELERIIPNENTIARSVWLESPEYPSKANITMEVHGYRGLHPFVNVSNPLYHCQYNKEHGHIMS
jgi:siderophore synthetase component